MHKSVIAVWIYLTLFTCYLEPLTHPPLPELVPLHVKKVVWRWDQQPLSALHDLRGYMPFVPIPELAICPTALCIGSDILCRLSSGARLVGGEWDPKRQRDDDDDNAVDDQQQ
jgi:hypothetical protein